MNLQALHNTYSQKLNEIGHIIRLQADGNSDLRQEGLIGAYQALKTDPHAKNRFLLNKAKWSMVSSLRKGRSVDNGIYKRKNLSIIHYDQWAFDDGILAEAVSGDGVEPVDEQAIFRIDLARFMSKLSGKERKFVKFKVIDGMSDVSIVRKLRITFPRLYEIKRNIRQQIGLSFAM